jgi:hypothetical protein
MEENQQPEAVNARQPTDVQPAPETHTVQAGQSQSLRSFDNSQTATPPVPKPATVFTSANQHPLTEPKKGKRIFGVVGVVVLVAILSVSASAYYFKTRDRTATPTSVAPKIASGRAVNASVTAANNSFGVDAFNQLVQQSPQDNIFISSASIAMALSMVYNGAGGSTQTALQKALDYTFNKLKLSLQKPE